MNGRSTEALTPEVIEAMSPTRRLRSLTPVDSILRHIQRHGGGHDTRSAPTVSRQGNNINQIAGTRPRSSRALLPPDREAEAAGGPGRLRNTPSPAAARITTALYRRPGGHSGPVNGRDRLFFLQLCRFPPPVAADRSTSTTLSTSPTAAAARNSRVDAHVIRFTTRHRAGRSTNPATSFERHSGTYCRRGPQRLATSNPAPGDVSSTKHRSPCRRRQLYRSARKAGGSNHLLMCPRLKLQQKITIIEPSPARRSCPGCR